MYIEFSHRHGSCCTCADTNFSARRIRRADLYCNAVASSAFANRNPCPAPSYALAYAFTDADSASSGYPGAHCHAFTNGHRDLRSSTSYSNSSAHRHRNTATPVGSRHVSRWRYIGVY